MVKPNHLPFREWIRSGDPLTPEQNQSLQEHLRSCPECSQIQAALLEVQSLFQSSGMVAPAIGFADRWQQRLVFHRIKQQRQKAWVLFFVASFMAVLILSLISGRFLLILTSPTVILSSAVYLWTYTLIALEGIREIGWQLVRLLPPISLLGFTFFLGFISLMSVLWLVTYRQLTAVRRVVS
jgi:hypothetical protein